MNGFSEYGGPPSAQDRLESLLNFVRRRDQMRFEQQQPQAQQQAPQTFSQPGFPQQRQLDQPGFSQQPQQLDQPGFSQQPQTTISALNQLIAHKQNSELQREQLLYQLDREFRAEAAQRRQQIQPSIREFVLPPGGSRLIPPAFQNGGNNPQFQGQMANSPQIPEPDHHEYEYASLRPDGTPRFR